MATANIDLNIVHLNNDVLFQIMTYLDVFDKMAMRQVCQRFQFLIDDYSARKMKSFKIDHSLDKHYKEIIKHFGKNLDILHLVSVNNLNRIDKLKNQFQAINKYCTKLSVLKVETRKSYGIMPLSSSVMSKLSFNNLKYLELHNIKLQRDLEFSSAFENIEVIKFENVANFSGHILGEMRKLTVLQLTACAQLKPNDLYDFFKINHLLKEIEINRCREIDEILINEIINNLLNIEKISVHFSFPASIDPSCLSTLTALRSLKLHNFCTYDVNRFIQRMSAIDSLEQWEINGENIKLFRLDGNAIEQLEKCTKLTDLSFVKCNFVNDELLLRLATKLDIKKFHLRDCWGFTTNGLMKLVQLSPHLTFLAIKNCTIPRIATIDIANSVLEPKLLTIDYDIDCGFRPYEAMDWGNNYDDDGDQYEYDWCCDSNSSDGE